jgi:hypothetical protein
MMSVEYYLRHPDGAFILVTTVRRSPDYDADIYWSSFRVFFGNEHDAKEPLSEVPVSLTESSHQMVTRARDGGSTWITTAKGELFIPTPFKKGPEGERIGTWTVPGGSPINLLVLDTDLIDFNPETMTACQKQ